MGNSEGWKIVRWDRSLGRGIVSCRDFQDVAFDGACATVDDFRIGEPVEVRLEMRSSGEPRITAIWPDDPRLDPGRVGSRPAPALLLEKVNPAEALLGRVSGFLDYRLLLEPSGIVLEGDDSLFEYGAQARLALEGVEYLEVPIAWSGKSISLASDLERAYVGGRAEVYSETIVVRIVDSSRNIYFIACETIATPEGLRPS